MDPTELLGSGDHSKGRRRQSKRLILETAQTTKSPQLLGLEKLIVFGSGRWALNSDQDLRVYGTAAATEEPSSLRDHEVVGRKAWPLVQNEMRKGLHARDDSLHRRISHRLHHRLAPREKRQTRHGHLRAQPADDVGLRRRVVGIGKPATVAFEESIEQRATIVRPATLTGHQINRRQEPYDIDRGRTPP